MNKTGGLLEKFKAFMDRIKSDSELLELEIQKYIH